jgi:hypothetical protein
MTMCRVFLVLILLCAAALSGCASPGARPGERRSAARDIPSDAKLVASGQPSISFLFPPGPGSLYLYDETSNSLLHTAQIGTDNSMGGLFLLDRSRRSFIGRTPGSQPDDDVILLTTIDPDHRYAIYYAASKAKVEVEGGENHHDPTTRPVHGSH